MSYYTNVKNSMRVIGKVINRWVPALFLAGLFWLFQQSGAGAGESGDIAAVFVPQTTDQAQTTAVDAGHHPQQTEESPPVTTHDSPPSSSGEKSS